MSRTKILAKNTLLISVSKLTVQAASFLLLPLYTQVLNTEDFGLLELVLTYSGLIVPALLLQTDAALFRILIDLRNSFEQTRAAVSSVWVLGVTTSTLTVFGVSLLELVIDQTIFSLVAIVFGSFMLLSLAQQTVRGLGKIKAYVWSSIVSGLAIVSGNLLTLLVLNWGVQGVLVSTATGYLLGAITAFMGGHIRSFLSIKSASRKELKRCLRYALPLIPNGLSWWSIDAGSRAILAATQGLGAIGIYGVAVRISQVFSQTFSYFNLAWVESASVSINDKDRSVFFSQVFNQTLRLSGSLILIMLATLPLYFPILVGPKFLEASTLVPMLLLSAFLNAWVTLYSSVYLAMMNTKAVLMTTVIAALIALSGAFLLVVPMGMLGVALASTIAWIVVLTLRHITLRRTLTIRYALSTWFSVISVLLAVIICTFLQFQYLSWNPWLWGLLTLLASIGINWNLIWTLTQRVRKKRIES